MSGKCVETLWTALYTSTKKEHSFSLGKMYKTTAIDHNGEKPEVVLPVDLGPVYMEWGTPV